MVINTNKINWKVVYQASIGVLGLAIISFFGYWLSTSYLSREQITQLVSSVGIFGPLVLILLKASTLVFAPIGGNPIYILSGLLYGFLPALFLVFSGDILGSAISFWLARKYGRKIVIKLTGGKSTKLIDKLYGKIGEWKGLMAASLFGIADYVNYVAGMTKIPFWKFMLIVVICRLPIDIVLVSLSFFPGQSIAIKSIYGLGAIIYIILVGIYWYKFSKKDKEPVGAN